MSVEKALDPANLKQYPRKPGYKYGLTESEEKFCRAMVETGGKTDASAAAAGISGGVAQRWRAKGYIKRRIAKLRDDAAARNDVSINWVVGKYKEVVEKGISLGDLRAANGALEGLGKYLGMFQSEKTNTEVKILGFFTKNDQEDMVRIARAAGFELEERANPPQEAILIEHNDEAEDLREASALSGRPSGESGGGDEASGAPDDTSGGA